MEQRRPSYTGGRAAANPKKFQGRNGISGTSNLRLVGLKNAGPKQLALNPQVTSPDRYPVAINAGDGIHEILNR